MVWTEAGCGARRYMEWLAWRCSARVLWGPVCNCSVVELGRRCPLGLPMIRVVELPGAKEVERQIAKTCKQQGKPSRMVYFIRKSSNASAISRHLDSDLPWVQPKEPPSRDRHVTRFTCRVFFVFQEDLIFQGLMGTTKALLSFGKLLRVRISEDVLMEDAHHFRLFNSWWDRSDFLEKVVPGSGMEFLQANRRCARDGRFLSVLRSEVPRLERTLTDPRCATPDLAFECSYCGLWNFGDRETNYLSPGPQRCGHLLPSEFDQVRERYRFREDCKTVVASLITDCFDPLPVVVDPHSSLGPGVCYVAIVGMLPGACGWILSYVSHVSPES